MKFKLAILSAVIAIQSAHAAIVVSYEAAGVQQTSLTGVLTETFNLLPASPLGAYTSVIGNYSTGGQISNPNVWGGANQTKYIALGAQSNTTSFTIDFKRDISFFGLYWSAMDGQNELRFYSHGGLVQSFNASSLMSPLSTAYNGDPNTGQNTGEKYAYINFVTTGSTRFDTVTFSNIGTSSGFESDNHSIFDIPNIKPSPTAEAPEPATMALVGVACLAALAARRRGANS